MLLGRAVIPHRASGANNPEDVGALAGLHGLRPAEESGGVSGEGLARAVEGGLRDGVRAREEVELNDSAGRDGHVVGLHLELAFADVDNGYARGGGGGAGLRSRGAAGSRGAGGGGGVAAAVAVAGDSGGEGNEGEESRGEKSELHLGVWFVGFGLWGLVLVGIVWSVGVGEFG